ncbi:MAG: molybdopterin converting factor subunit 1 [Dehalococcoidia bacterium]
MSGRQPLRVKARFFAVYREKAGRREQDVDLEEGATAGDLVWRLGDEHDGLLLDIASLVVAVNGEYVPLSHPLREGDEVALIPPVSGG